MICQRTPTLECPAVAPGARAGRWEKDRAASGVILQRKVSRALGLAPSSIGFRPVPLPKTRYA